MLVNAVDLAAANAVWQLSISHCLRCSEKVLAAYTPHKLTSRLQTHFSVQTANVLVWCFWHGSKGMDIYLFVPVCVAFRIVAPQSCSNYCIS
jgi:hypothetical protein